MFLLGGTGLPIADANRVFLINYGLLHLHYQPLLMHSDSPWPLNESVCARVWHRPCLIYLSFIKTHQQPFAPPTPACFRLTWPTGQKMVESTLYFSPNVTFVGWFHVELSLVDHQMSIKTRCWTSLCPVCSFRNKNKYLYLTCHKCHLCSEGYFLLNFLSL